MYIRRFSLTGDVKTPIHLFKVCWNDRLVSYFSLMYQYGINKNVIHSTFSRAEFNNFL